MTWADSTPANLCGSFKAVVSSAGTRVQLDDNTCSSCTIRSEASNTGLIFVGNKLVSSSNGFELSAGESISVDIKNTNLIYIDAAVNTDGVSVFWVNLV